MDWLGLVTSAFGAGGISGLVGSGINAFTEFKKQKLLFEHETKKMQHDEEMAQLKMDNDRQKAQFALHGIQVQAEAQIAIAEQESFDTSHQSDKATYSDSKTSVYVNWLMGTVDFFRGMIRPGVTLYFTYLLTQLFTDISSKVKVEDLPSAQALEIYQMIVWTILYIATTVIMWWYGTRAKLWKPEKLNLISLKK